MQSSHHHLHLSGQEPPLAGEARRPEVLSYLFFLGLIAATFLV